MTRDTRKATPGALGATVVPRLLMLGAAGAVVAHQGPGGGTTWGIAALLAAAALAVFLVPRWAWVHAWVEWSVFLVDGLLVGLCLLVASGGGSEPSVLLGVYFLAVVVAVVAARSPGWPLAALAAPGLFLATRPEGGAWLVAAQTLLLAAASSYFLLAIRRVRSASEALVRARRESRELWALLEISDTVTGSLDLPKVMGTIVRRVSELVGAESCSILIAKDENGLVIASNDAPEVDMLQVDLAKYPELQRAIETREPVVVEDVEHDPLLDPVRDVLLEKGYRSMLVIPLVFGSEVLGTLFMRARRDRPFAFEEIRFCKLAAGASANALKNALLYQDVRREAELHRATGETLRRVLDCTPDMIVATDPSGLITEFSGGAEKITGVSTRAATGRKLSEILQDDGIDTIPTLSNAAGGARDIEIQPAHGDGAREIGLVSAPLLDSEGAAAGRVWVGRDHTQLRQVQRSLAQVERLQTLGEIVAGVAHELNNPLSAVLGYSELLRRKAEVEDDVRDLERVVQSARRCKRIVQNLLGFARKHQPEKKFEDLNRCVRKVVELKSYSFRNSNVSVEIDLDEDLPSTLFDYYQVEQVLLNLINNAEHALRDGGRGGKIRVRTFANADSIALEVEDDGPGIPPEVQERVFDPFFTTKEVGSGTGLGLSVAFGIVQEHGGSLTLAPYERGRGARFTLTLPRVAMPATESDRADRGSADATGSLKGRRILVAEDEPVVLEFLTRVLRQEGVEVLAAKDGEEAWQKIEGQDFDLVLADIRMPRMDGQELYERIAAERPDLLRRVVFSSGDLTRPETLAFLESLPNRILAKPLQVETVRHVLERALELRRAS